MIKDNLDFNQSVKPNTEFLEQLRQKLPEFFTSSDSDKEAEFDMEKFQKALKEQNVEELSSGYQLDFIGKNYAKKQAGERPTTVIVPDNEHNEKIENKDSKNLFFTGDNLEVLRHLQQNYTNSVDVIYIDPPYNTGSDGFVYPDKFEYSDDQLKDMFNLNDDEVRRMKSIQGKSTHSAWLTFMYPRLYLAKKVLKDTGFIFISIDDNEQANLKLLMDDIFGENSCIGNITWLKKRKGSFLSKKIISMTEYCLVYVKNNKDTISLFGGKADSSESQPIIKRTNSYGKLTFESGIVNSKLKDGVYKKGIYGKDNNPVSLENDIEIKDGKIITDFVLGSNFIWNQDFLNSELSKGTQIVINTLNFQPRAFRIFDDSNFKGFSSYIDGVKISGTNEDAYEDLEKLFNQKNIFSYSKPVNYILEFIKATTHFNKNALILDFFAGSSTTADAVLHLNDKDGGNRQFIMCTLPEPTFSINSDGKEVPTKGGEIAYKAGFRSIDEISRERIIRASAKIKSQSENLSDSFDGGFKHFNVVSANQQTLDKLDFDNEMQLDIFDDMISAFSSVNLDVKGNAEGFDTILQTYLVSDGYKFDVSVEMLDFAGVKLPYVNNQRIYLITNDWTAQNTKALVNAIGKNEISVQTIVVYGYTIDMESLRELEIALNQLENKVHLLVRY